MEDMERAKLLLREEQLTTARDLALAELQELGQYLIALGSALQRNPVDLVLHNAIGIHTTDERRRDSPEFDFRQVSQQLNAETVRSKLILFREAYEDLKNVRSALKK